MRTVDLSPVIPVSHPCSAVVPSARALVAAKPTGNKDESVEIGRPGLAEITIRVKVWEYGEKCALSRVLCFVSHSLLGLLSLSVPCPEESAV